MLLGSLAFGGLLFLGGGSASADSYTVQSGDTLKGIAQSHATTVDKLVFDNGIQNANLIYSGETIEINNDELPVTSTQKTQVVQVQPSVQQVTAPVSTPSTPSTTPVEVTTEDETPTSNSGNAHDRFISAGGTEAMWTTIVLPESGGNPDAVSPNGYTGLGQTKESWGHGSVEIQTTGMIDYANSRYGSIENAVSFRASNNWW